MVRMVMTGIVAVALAGSSLQGQSATQVVQFQVTAVNQMAMSGDPSPMVIGLATAGSAPTAVNGTGSTWAITTNEANKKVTAAIDQPLPTGVTLEVFLAAPSGATSAGHVALGVAAADVVTGISAGMASALPIAYRLSAAITTAITAPQTRTVTFTIVSGS
ncbi:MAG: hypothetical protein WD801_09375 [Gemmatimonadaceae bacterium]